MTQTTVVQATKVMRQEWMSFNLTQTPVQTDAGIVSQRYVNISFATNEFLGDSEGKPLQVIQLNLQSGGCYLNPEEINSTEYFGEVVTRADGTSTTLLALISEKLDHAVATKPAPVQPTNP
jgi:hypothetical protein